MKLRFSETVLLGGLKKTAMLPYGSTKEVDVLKRNEGDS